MCEDVVALHVLGLWNSEVMADVQHGWVWEQHRYHNTWNNSDHVLGRAGPSRIPCAQRTTLLGRECMSQDWAGRGVMPLLHLQRLVEVSRVIDERSCLALCNM